MVQTPVKLETLPLIVSTVTNLHVTEEQFEELARLNRDLRLERTAEGELIVSPPTGWETGARNNNLSGELYLGWRNAGSQGQMFDSSTGFRLPNGAIRSPDASWVSAEHWNDLTTEQKGTFAEICPDFVVELRSRSDSRASLQTKMQEYIANGARLGLFIDPFSRQVEIYRPHRDVEILDNPLEISLEEILPGLILNLQRIWGS